MVAGRSGYASRSVNAYSCSSVSESGSVIGSSSQICSGSGIPSGSVSGSVIGGSSLCRSVGGSVGGSGSSIGRGRYKLLVDRSIGNLV